VPVTGDQPNRLVIVARQPAPRFLRVRAGIDRFAAEVDAAREPCPAAANAPGEVRFGHRRIGTGDEQTLRLVVPHDVDRMFYPPRPAGEHDGRVARWRGRRRGLAEGERKQDEAERVGQQQECAETGDHNALRNERRTAVRATQVATIVRAKGSAARISRSIGPSVAPPVSSPASAAPLANSSRTTAAANAPARLPTSASIRIFRWKRWVTCTSVAPMPCITSMVNRWVSSAPRAARTTAAEAAMLSSSTRPNATHCSSRSDRSSGPTLSRWAVMRAPGASAWARCWTDCRSTPEETSKSINAGTGSSALCAAGPSQRSSVRRISLSGTASTEVTPAVERSAPTSGSRLAPPPGTSSAYRDSIERLTSAAVLARARPLAAMSMIEKLMIAITQGVGPPKR